MKSHHGYEDTFQNIADLFRRHRYKSALQLIDAQLEDSSPKATKELLLRWTVLQVFCNLKSGNLLGAVETLDALQPLPKTEEGVLQTIECSSDNFVLYLLAAIFPLCCYNYSRQDVTQLPPPFPAAPQSTTILLMRLYELLEWTRRCKANILITLDIWEARHVLVISVLVNALIQLDLFGAALILVDSEILRLQPDSGVGLLLAGRVYLAMGNVEPAEYHLGVAECLCDPAKAKTVTAIMNAMLLSAQNNNFAAISELELVTSEPHDFDNEYPVEAGVTEKEANQKIIRFGLEKLVAYNNAAVASLYCGCLKDTTRSLESILISPSQPTLRLPPLRNLITVYEFSPQRSRKIAALRKKLLELGTEETELLDLFTTDTR